MGKSRKQERFERFAKHFEEAVEKLGLGQVRFDLYEGVPEWTEIDEDEGLCAAGYSRYHPEAQYAEVYFNSAADDDPEYIAWHEACEVLLMDLMYVATAAVSRRKFDDEEWTTECHRVINRICHSRGLKPNINKPEA